MTNQRASSALGLDPAALSRQRWSLHISLGLRCRFPDTVINETRPPPQSIISGLWVKTGWHKVSVACFTTLTLTDSLGFLWPVLTLREGWGLLTWSRRTWGPPRFGKCGEEASSEPGEGRDTRSRYRSYVQGDRFVRMSNKALFPGQGDKLSL